MKKLNKEELTEALRSLARGRSIEEIMKDPKFAEEYHKIREKEADGRRQKRLETETEDIIKSMEKIG